MDAPLPLRPGTTGEAVADLQHRLGRAGHPCDGDPPGHYGAVTEAQVRAFQERRGLRGDGVCGAQTWQSLVESGLTLGDRLLYLRAPMLRGDDVADLQRRLGGLGFDAGKVDGILGTATAAAVTEFQRNVGLPTDGICGPDTVEALRRVATRSAGDGPLSTVASLREAEGLRRGRSMAGVRVAVAEPGGLGALTDALARALRDAGAVASVLREPDESDRAASANAFEAAVFVNVCTRDETGGRCCFYAHEGFQSVAGRRLAELATRELVARGIDAAEPRGMRIPVLRETRMPAVLVEVGPPRTVVAEAPAIVGALATAIERWIVEPLDADPT